MKRTLGCILCATAVAVIAGCGTMGAMKEGGEAMAKDAMMPFGGPSDAEYAASLWAALASGGMVGANAVQTAAYPGQHPHGAVLTNVDGQVTVNGETGPVIVKTNFGGEGVSVDAVNANPGQYLGAFTVMFKRAGYDPDNNDWFWAKYLPDGTLDKNPKGMMLAGKVAKGNAEAGCIACHSAAPGGDLVFTHDRFR